MYEKYEMKWFNFKNKKQLCPTVTFATTCWNCDWKKILLDEEYLSKYQIANHNFSFFEKILVVNNVNEKEYVIQKAKNKVNKGVLTNFYDADKYAEEVMSFFSLEKKDFKAGKDAKYYIGVDDNWLYYNALGVLTSIYHCKSDYLLYLTGDSFLKQSVSWIDKAITMMEKKSNYKVANLIWNEKYDEAKKESYRKNKDFFISKKGFSDQLFLVKRKDFQDNIYNEIRDDAAHFPRGDVFEKRVYSYMINHGWKRITFRHGSYYHN